MTAIRSFHDLDVWQAAKNLAVEIYRISAVGDLARDFGFRDQVRRAAVSVVSNIAEGFERSGDREFIQFLATAKGSCGELHAQLWLGRDLGYVSPEKFDALQHSLSSVSKQIGGLMSYLRRANLRGAKFQSPRGAGSR